MWRWSCSVQIICWLEESFSVRFHIKNHISAFFALVLHGSFYFIYTFYKNIMIRLPVSKEDEWTDSDWYIRLVYCFLEPASVEISSIPLTAVLQKKHSLLFIRCRDIHDLKTKNRDNVRRVEDPFLFYYNCYMAIHCCFTTYIFVSLKPS